MVADSLFKSSSVGGLQRRTLRGTDKPCVRQKHRKRCNDTQCNTHRNAHCNTLCNTHCNTHCDTHCDTHCNAEAERVCGWFYYSQSSVWVECSGESWAGQTDSVWERCRDTQCNTHSCTLCNTQCNTHCDTHCNTRCSTTIQHTGRSVCVREHGRTIGVDTQCNTLHKRQRTLQRTLQYKNTTHRQASVWKRERPHERQREKEKEKTQARVCLRCRAYVKQQTRHTEIKNTAIQSGIRISCKYIYTYVYIYACRCISSYKYIHTHTARNSDVNRVVVHTDFGQDRLLR